MSKPQMIPLSKEQAKKLPAEVLLRMKKLKKQTEKRIKKWNKKPKSETENKCWFREWVIESFGEESACKTLNVEYDSCPMKCDWILKCPHCNGRVIKHIITQYTDTSGLTSTVFGAACPNLQCPSKQNNIEPKVAKPDYYA